MGTHQRKNGARRVREGRRISLMDLVNNGFAKYQRKEATCLAHCNAVISRLLAFLAIIKFIIVFLKS